MTSAALWLLCCVAAVSGLTMQVEPQTETCVFDDIEQGKDYTFHFEVTRGGLLDINAKIISPRNTVIKEKTAYFNKKEDEAAEAEGKIEFKAEETGRYKFCFDNTMSRWTAKVVSFETDSEQHSTHENLAKLEHLGPMVDSVIKISDDLDTIERIQHHMRVREQQHRDVIDRANSRVLWVSLMEAVVLLLVCYFQLVHVKTWFSGEQGKFSRV